MPKGEGLAAINTERASQLRREQLKKYVVAESGCWEWQGGIAQDGYGKLKRNGKTLRAHRVFFETFVAPVPANMWVLHKCDNPLCVNPAHLWLGTQADNERDKDEKGRRPPPWNMRLVEHDGHIRTVKEWAEVLQCNPEVLKGRLTRGWDVAKTLTHPFSRSESQRISQLERIENGTLVKNEFGQYQ